MQSPTERLNLEKSGINCQVFGFLLQLLCVFDLAREGKRRCIPISWATVNAAWRPSSSITAQLRSGEHMVPTSAIPRVSHEWCPHKSCPGERKKSLKSIAIQKEPPCRASCSLQTARVDMFMVSPVQLWKCSNDKRTALVLPSYSGPQRHRRMMGLNYI